jgi:predicted phosphoribosyltransferase
VRFLDRDDAGAALAEQLGDRFAAEDAVVLGIPRGGVVVAAAVARALGLPLDVVVPRKLGAPGNPELGIGAIASGVRVLDDRIVRSLGVSPDYIEAEAMRQEGEIARRLRAYRGDRPPLELGGRTALIVDDGIATGSTAIAAARWARANGAARVVLAVPVAPPQTAGILADEAVEVVVLRAPRAFGSVGEWYERFDQTADREVVALLADRRERA